MSWGSIESYPSMYSFYDDFVFIRLGNKNNLLSRAGSLLKLAHIPLNGNILGKVGGSRILGRVEISWTNVFKATNMEIVEWGIMDKENVKPMTVQITMKENQVPAIMFCTDITHFEDVLAPFNTYLVFVVQVKEPTFEYKSALNDYIWTIDRSTTVEPIEKVTPLEDPLPQPTRLTLTTFDTFEYQPKEYEFDVLSIVINDSHPTKTTRGKRVQEFIIMEGQVKTIEPELVAYKMKSTTAVGSILLVPLEDEIIPVANIQGQLSKDISSLLHMQNKFNGKMLKIQMKREGLGEAYDGDIAFTNSLKTFGGGLNDPISVMEILTPHLSFKYASYLDYQISENCRNCPEATVRPTDHRASDGPSPKLSRLRFRSTSSRTSVAFQFQQLESACSGTDISHGLACGPSGSRSPCSISGTRFRALHPYTLFV
ncbi:hypothetical protein T459_12015 [Capsicum annuum]|uniref:Uncharacterized protein n=1 Tax=Capsicum annuum TaxID=4072 RepID=A0A2G2ZNK0_CAPAN|nr:hypothetical protein T459_12015 [Capsicum annuum]